MCHLAAACANVRVTQFPVDILGPLYYSVKPRATAVMFENGRVRVPEGHGLGIQLSADELQAIGT
jgi:L-alanine-DL-glutamate epimerase-like enolase superfamily enzyme